MIKALIFDFGGVIYKTKWKELNDFFLKKNGFSIALQEGDKELIKIYNNSDIGKEDFRNFFFKIKPDISDIDRILKDYKKGYARFKILNHELLKIIENLKKKGFMLFGFTDIKKEHYEANLEAGIYDSFIEIFASYKFGCLKSEKEAFEKLITELKRYNLAPQECVFIDDHIPNIRNADSFGFKTIHYAEFPSVELLKKKLNEILSKSD